MGERIYLQLQHNTLHIIPHYTTYYQVPNMPDSQITQECKHGTNLSLVSDFVLVVSLCLFLLYLDSTLDW